MAKARKEKDDRCIDSEWSSIFFRKTEVILAKLVQECDKLNIAIGIFAGSEAATGSFFRVSDYMRFEISEDVKYWTLKDALHKRINEKMGTGPKIQLGELFKAPLVWVTPRSEWLSTAAIAGGKLKRNYFCQVTVIKGRFSKLKT